MCICRPSVFVLLSTRNFLLYTLLPYADFDALMLKTSMDGFGTKEDLIIATIAPLDNARIRAAKERHDEKVRTCLLQYLYNTRFYYLVAIIGVLKIASSLEERKI